MDWKRCRNSLRVLKFNRVRHSMEYGFDIMSRLRINTGDFPSKTLTTIFAIYKYIPNKQHSEKRYFLLNDAGIFKKSFGLQNKSVSFSNSTSLVMICMYMMADCVFIYIHVTGLLALRLEYSDRTIYSVSVSCSPMGNSSLIQWCWLHWSCNMHEARQNRLVHVHTHAHSASKGLIKT